MASVAASPVCGFRPQLDTCPDEPSSGTLRVDELAASLGLDGEDVALAEHFDRSINSGWNRLGRIRWERAVQPWH